MRCPFKARLNLWKRVVMVSPCRTNIPIARLCSTFTRPGWRETVEMSGMINVGMTWGWWDSKGGGGVGCMFQFMLISQSVGSQQWAPAGGRGKEDTDCSVELTVTGWRTVEQTGSYVCIIITANPIIITKIINYPNSKLNWIIFNSLTTTLLFSPINRRLLMIRHFCHPGFQNIDQQDDIWRQAPPLPLDLSYP